MQNKIHRILFFFLCTFAFSHATVAQVIRGKITDQSGEAIPFVSVYLKNSTFGVSANQKGDYLLQVKPGNYTLVFSLVGFQKEEREVKISSQQSINLDIILRETTEMRALEIYSDKRDIANEVVGFAREKRGDFASKTKSVAFKSYMKISLEKESPVDSLSTDSLASKDSLKTIKSDLETLFKKERLNLIESISEVKVSPNGFREYIQGYHDYAETRPFTGVSARMGMELGENNIAPAQQEDVNPYLLSSNKAFLEYDFYSSLINLPQLTDKPLLSPIGSGSALSYRYELESTFFENNRKIYKIKVSPIFKTEALFQGSIFIEDSTFALTAVDLNISPFALIYHHNFRIIQNYKEVEPGVYLPFRREFIYTVKEEKTTIHGSTRTDHSEFVINPTFLKGTFGNEVQTYSDLAFDRDSSYWETNRTIAMKESEMEYIQLCDSLKKYYSSAEYLEEKDSAYNRITFWDVTLSGIGYRNRKKNYSFFINPIIAQLVPFGIGGYRHRLGGTFTKEFANATVLETTGDIDYGFTNKDVRGKIGAGFTYIPKKFVRTFIRAGDFYDMINTYASLGSIFSRSNYVRAQTFSVAQRMEVTNGLFAELTLEYSDQKPITDLKLEQWSSEAFGEVNEPIDFVRYIKSEIRLDVKYRYKQKYIIKRNKKIILGSKWPELNFVYRKGIPNAFGSEVNFDYLELGINHEFNIARIGNATWNVLTGSFVNQKNLRILEHRYFRGSDAGFFSDPVRSFQLLGPTLETSNYFFRANYMHQFEGLFFNKIPLLNRLKLTEAAGTGILIIPEKKFAHSEFYFGIQKPFRIKQQRFRIGIYAVTADSSLNKAVFTWKVGIQFYNNYSKRWSF